jgi:hypothetical protein
MRNHDFVSDGFLDSAFCCHDSRCAGRTLQCLGDFGNAFSLSRHRLQRANVFLRPRATNYFFLLSQFRFLVFGSRAVTHRFDLATTHSSRQGNSMLTPNIADRMRETISAKFRKSALLPRLTPGAICARVAAFVACVSDAPRVLPDEEIVERIFRAIALHQTGLQRRPDR